MTSELLYQLHQAPGPAADLIIALDGWVDAGSSLTTLQSSVTRTAALDLIAEFDTDVLLDHRARRPNLAVVDGLTMGLDWPTLQLLQGVDGADKRFLLLIGAEPDTRWRRFSNQVVELCLQAGVTRTISLGAYPAATPHTRPVEVTTTASDMSMLTGRSTVAGSIEVPSGVHAAIEQRAAEEQIPGIGLWAQVPYYAASNDYPAATTALLEALTEIGGPTFPDPDLVTDAERTGNRLDGTVSENEKYREMVAELEATHDQAKSVTDDRLPSGDELEAELQQYLRDQDHPRGDS